MTGVACCGVDWGTTNFRLWAFDTTGAVVARQTSRAGAFDIKPDGFAPALEAVLAIVGAGGDTPVIVSGMAGSVQGWVEAQYLDVPASLMAIADKAVAAPAAGRDVRILPGAAQRSAEAPDVMRGEETQLLGAVELAGIEGVVCMPGTHSKWVEIREGKIANFRSVMTGELFALLAERSTLSVFAGGNQALNPRSEAFAAGVRQALARPEALTRDLFSVRAGPLLGVTAADDARDYLSGLLIGAELAAAPDASGEVALIAGDALAAAYAEAFKLAGREHLMLDGERTAQAGLMAAARRIWPHRFDGARS